MSNQTDLKLAKWPFFLGDAVLLGGCAYLIYAKHSPPGIWEAAIFAFCALAGAVIAVIPFVMEYRAAARMVETSGVVATVERIQDLEKIADQIGKATGQWLGVQEQSARTNASAKDIAERMTTEAAAFTDFMKKANDSERASLRLEVEKLRRSEGEFLQIIVRMLDHTFALHQAALRSGQPALIEQLTQFQNSCRDVVRRIGLIPFTPAADEPFDPKFHKTPESQFAPLADAKVRDIHATGFTYQGQLIRPALVSLHAPSSEETTQITAAAEPDPATLETSEIPVTPEVKTKPVKQKSKVEEQALL